MKKRQISIRLLPELIQQLQKQADELGISFNACIIMTLEKGLQAMG